MSTIRILVELARQVRRNTIQLLEETPDKWLLAAPNGTSNHILWHAGHALWLQDLLCVRLLTGTDELPNGWASRFGMDCQPVHQTTDWPAKSQLTQLLTKQWQRVSDLLEAATEDQLAKTADASRGTASIADRIIHGFHDEAKHCGEIYLIQKLCAKGQCRLSQ